VADTIHMLRSVGFTQEGPEVLCASVPECITFIGIPTPSSDFRFTYCWEFATCVECLKKRVPEGKDSARLDWLVQSGAHMAFSKDGDNCWLHWAYGPEDDEEDNDPKNQKPIHDSPRDTIDAEMWKEVEESA